MPRRSRKHTPQEKVKISQAAKKRQRHPGGSKYGGEFLAGFGAHKAPSSPSRPPGAVKGRSYTGSRRERSKGETREAAAVNKQQILEELRKQGVTGAKAEQLARQYARDRTFRQTGEAPTADDMAGSPTKVRQGTRKEVQRNLADKQWQSGQRDVYGHRWKEDKRKGPLTPTEFYKEEMAPSHKQWLDQQLQDPHSTFNAGLDPTTTTRTKGRTVTPGARRRLEKYTEALQQGHSHQEAMMIIQQDKRGQSPGSRRGSSTGVGSVTSQDLERSRNLSSGSRDKYETMQLKPDEFKFGVEAATPRSVEKLKEVFPGLRDKDYVRLREVDRISINDEIQKNVRWAQETKRAQIISEKAGRPSDPDRVTFFTTNFGTPSASVPSDSLIGQYIINRRKSAMMKEGSATRGSTKGFFPQAVRDQHLIEVKAMGGASAAGRFGLVQESGWRAGSKASKGFGRRAPIGSGVLTDSSGRPIYDRQGNVRYSAGASRAYEVGSDRVAGLRIFIG